MYGVAVTMPAAAAATICARDAEEREVGVCRTCLAPIWNEGGTIGHVRRADGWSDRIEQGGDSLVCFKAINYRHVPLAGDVWVGVYWDPSGDDHQAPYVDVYVCVLPCVVVHARYSRDATGGRWD